MIFDLLTLKDPFNRWRIYPNSEYTDIFNYNDFHVSSYDIAEGRYFGRNKTWRGEADWFRLKYENLLAYGSTKDVNCIVFEYRANHPFYVTTVTETEEVVEEFPATDVFKRGAVKFVDTVEHYSHADSIVFTSHVHEEDTSVHEGDYVIIKKFEFLTV